ncbi:transcriptional regulator, GntR family [Catenulispora acidiphila DSM 44928]|jgi:DNA-binding transcriptional regulator YhcF (GntR family)|uniref:Transcriptional regulator, GntR family n=1 Tax=Catenulispora acidiphila (strain DSM 44928 / JCM 14897 / NBRC 102108 / NRRL B-24433 / ID139908) TaxID=479433 RepID=C7QFU1_CATAD|nr:GntR family transcriptional regulator [Catenulispora acidiphila]ACU70918.1 transcriptional regulator, GntR family [Catenulispora acidiphila DSM 44928]
MIVELDDTSPVPPYEQIRAQVAAMIGSGALPPGTRLPPIRQLAGDLGLAVNTVARAYRELEAGKLVASRVRTGTVVAPRTPHAPDDRTAADTRRLLTEAVRSFAATTRRLGIADHDALAAITAELRGEASGS